MAKKMPNFDMEEVLREIKTDRQGIRFKPSVVKMAKMISKNRKLSMADYIERLIIDDYKKEVQKSDT